MEQTLLQGKYPISALKVKKNETSYISVPEILHYFKTKIEEHQITTFIAFFDHYAHTTSLPDGVVASEIKAAQHVVFCFGKDINDPMLLALRPRSIGVAELENSFLITFLDPPNPMAYSTMASWVKSLKME